MDSTQALATILRASAQGDKEEAFQACLALQEWLGRDGFLPNISEAWCMAGLNDLGEPILNQEDQP